MWIVFSLCRKFFWRKVENCNLRDPVNILMWKKFLMKFFYNFNQSRTFSKEIWAFCPKIFSRVVKIAFCMSIGSFLSKKFIWEISIFSNLLRPRPKKMAFCREIFGGVVKTAIYVSVGSFWQKLLPFVN